MGAAISGHWDLGETATSRDYDTLARCLGGSNQGGNVHISNSTTPIVLIFVSGDS